MRKTVIELIEAAEEDLIECADYLEPIEDVSGVNSAIVCAERAIKSLVQARENLYYLVESLSSTLDDIN